MAQLGNSTTPATGFFFDDVGNSQFWSGTYVMPAGGGTLTDLWVYVGGDGATATAQLCIWGNAGLVYHSGNITLPSNGRTVGGQSWQHVSGINLYLGAGNLNFGFWTSGNVVWTYESSGSTNFQRSLSGGPGSLSSGGTEGSGALGAYIVYTPGGVAHVRRSSAWSAGVVPKVRRSGAWTTATNTQDRRSGVWKSGT
jgi:hypothetical protein